MGEGPELLFREALVFVPDPRHLQGRRHPLAASLALAVCAMLGDCRSLAADARQGRLIPGRLTLLSSPCRPAVER